MNIPKKTYNIQLLIDSQLEHVRLLASAIRGIGKELSLTSKQVGQLELMLVEAVNNVIEHAYEFQAGNTVKVLVECDPEDKFKMIISDQGHSLAPEQAGTEPDNKFPLPTPEDLPEGGWGLSLINMLADSLHYEHDQHGNHLHVSKHIAA